MQDQQKQLIAKLKEAQNVLVTVSKNPSVDQLAAAIGMTLALNKLDKHATAVFSGQVPSTIEFLKPEDTLEKTTDSLRDFIIALDKSKADKLRYKVEDQVVRIFITPYRTSISEKDLDFSQGDFNVDVVLALGVPGQQDLDEAIQAHGRILHDATVAALSIDGPQELGTLNLSNPNTSSLSEMVASIIEEIDPGLIDSQIATALLTGIVAMTNRFSNDRTKPETMKVCSVLMSAGANQQLIATQLEAPQEEAITDSVNTAHTSDTSEQPTEPGMLEIEHSKSPEQSAENSDELSDQPVDQKQEDTPQIHVDEDGQLTMGTKDTLPEVSQVHGGDQAEQEPHENESVETHVRVIEPPSRGGTLSANTQEEGFDATTEELTLPPTEMPFLSHEKEPESPMEPLPAPAPYEAPELKPLTTAELSEDTDSQPQVAQDQVNTTGETLAEIEKAVGSPHLNASESAEPSEKTIDEARNAVEAALNTSSASVPQEPIEALNAQLLGPELHDDIPKMQAPQSAYRPAPGFESVPLQPRDGTIPGNSPGDQALDMPIPTMNISGSVSSFPGVMPASNEAGDGLPPPPPVPPPPIFPS
jgi:hypothetical protein